MVEENKKLFSYCNCETITVSKIKDFEKIDAIVFPSSFSKTQWIFLWEEFLSLIIKKMILDNFPVWLMWKSIELFYEKIHFEKKDKIKYFEKEIYIKLLDTKPFKIFIEKLDLYEQKRNWFNLFQKEFDEIWEIKDWLFCTFKRKKSLITIFSADYWTDYRFHEYFVNEVI